MPDEKKEDTIEKVEVIVREGVEDVKEVAAETKKAVCCCVRVWSCCLNSIEGLCGGLAGCCIALSDIALGCSACLEKIDCDKK